MVQEFAESIIGWRGMPDEWSGGVWAAPLDKTVAIHRPAAVQGEDLAYSPFDMLSLLGNVDMLAWLGDGNRVLRDIPHDVYETLTAAGCSVDEFTGF